MERRARRRHRQPLHDCDADGAHAPFVPQTEPHVEAPWPHARLERAQQHMLRVRDRWVAGELT